MSYTKGPWEKDYNGTKGHIKSIAPHERGWTPTVCKYDVYVAFGVAGRRVEYIIQDENEREANGFLISAAPDMYEALKNIIELHESEERIIKKCDYLAAVKAINKADGK